MGPAASISHALGEGQAIQLPDETIIVPTGSSSNSSFTTLVEKYNPATNAWSVLGNLDQFHWAARTAYWQSDSILVIGGATSISNGAAPHKASSSVFNLRTNVATPGPTMLAARSAFTEVLWTSVPDEGLCSIRRIVQVFGGAGDDSILSAGEKLDLGLGELPPKVALSVQSIQIADSSLCFELDTAITVTNNSCYALTLLGVRTIDSGLIVTTDTQFPIVLASGNASPLSFKIVPISQDSASSSALEFTFLGNSGDTIRRYAKVNANILVPVKGLSGPVSLNFSRSVCNGLDAILTYVNPSCQSIVVNSVTISGAGSPSYSLKVLGDSLVAPGDTLRLEVTGGFSTAGTSNVMLNITYFLSGKSQSMITSISVQVAASGSEPIELAIQYPQQPILGDTIEVPIYLQTNQSLNVSGMKMDLKYNTDLLHLVSCVTSGTSMAATAVLSTEEIGHTIVFDNQGFNINPSLPLFILKFASTTSSTECTNLSIDQLSFDQSSSVQCQTLASRTRYKSVSSRVAGILSLRQ